MSTIVGSIAGFPVTRVDDRINPDNYRIDNYVGPRYSDVLWPISAFLGPVGGVIDMSPEWVKPVKGIHARRLVSGFTRGSNNAVLGGVTVDLYDAPTKVLVDTVVSDAGGYYVAGTPYDTTCFAVAYLAGSPDVTGATVNNLVGT